MPHDIRVIAAHEFLRADVHGQYDLAASKQLLHNLAAALAGQPDRHILLDVRDTAIPQLTSIDLFDLVQTLRQLGLGVLNKIAILRVVKDVFDRAKFFEMLATDRGFQVCVFEEFEAAFSWLYGHGQVV